MPVDWKLDDAMTRLLAAVIAAHNICPVNNKKIADIYAREATTSSIDNKLRSIRAEATAMKAAYEAGVGGSSAAGAVKAPKKKATTAKMDTKDKVASGRVTKSTSGKASLTTKVDKGKSKMVDDGSEVEEEDDDFAGENDGEVGDEGEKTDDDEATIKHEAE